MRIFLLLFFVSPLFLYSQDRVNSETPKILDTFATIKTAKGWIKNDVGKWVSKQNAIPIEHSDIDLNCIDFIEYSLLTIEYKSEYYYCLLHKTTSETNFWVFNYFEKSNIKLVDTSINLKIQLACKGSVYKVVKNSEILVNEIFKEFANENSSSEYDALEIDINVNSKKNNLRFFVSEKYSSKCTEETAPLEKKYFETSLSNLPFFEYLIPQN